MLDKSLEQDTCLICQRIALIKEGKNPYFVIELKSSYVVLGDYQLYKGYVVVLSKFHTSELHFLPKSNRTDFLQEIAQVGEAVYKTFEPKKLNYEILGNEDPHLHCHIFPRHIGDLNPGMPIWVIDKKIRTDKKYLPTPSQLDKMTSALKENILKLSK